MTDKGLIKQEIERRIKNLEFSLENNCVEKYSKLDILGNITTLESLLQFINSLPEEPASENLEEYAKKLTKGAALDKHNLIWMCKKGAEWQKQQMKEALQTEYEKGRFDMREEMMKNTVLETEVLMDCDGDGIETPYEEWLTLEDTEIPCVPDSFKDGDIVKVVLIKEDLP